MRGTASQNSVTSIDDRGFPQDSRELRDNSSTSWLLRTADLMADFSSALAAHTREAERSLVTTAKTAQTAAAKVSDRENDKRARSLHN